MMKSTCCSDSPRLIVNNPRVSCLLGYQVITLVFLWLGRVSGGYLQSSVKIFLMLNAQGPLGCNLSYEGQTNERITVLLITGWILDIQSIVSLTTVNYCI